jgi:hypothetical protein
MPEKEHPEYPQDYEKIPSLRFIVDQVSKIEDAQACGTGYYKTLKDVLARIGKLDVSLNQLTQTNADLKKVVDSTTVAVIIGKKSDEINQMLKDKMDLISTSNANTLSRSIREIEIDNKELNKGFVRLMKEISETNAKLKSQIQLQQDCVVIKSWKAWLIVIVTLGVGFYAGKVF